MSNDSFLTISGQVAGHLREKILRGHWQETIPGVHQLSADLGVNRKTVEAALRKLEQQGLLVGQGPGRKRRIVIPSHAEGARPLQIRILLSDASDRKLGYIVELQHELIEAGHVVHFASSAMMDLEMDVKRISLLVEKSGADAWIVAGGSQEVLGWFATQNRPVFALFGRRRGLPIAGGGPDKLAALTAAMNRLFNLGHQRIVLLVRPRRRLPEPGAFERAFLDCFKARGIQTGAFNLPNWIETVNGFHWGLIALFRMTPPTALIIDEAPFYTAARQFLAQRGIRVPEDISLICTDPDPTFEWCKVPIAHIRWDSQLLTRRIVRWAENVSRGKKDIKQTFTPAEFVDGGTVGRVSRK